MMLHNLTWEGAAALAAPLSYPPIINTMKEKICLERSENSGTIFDVFT